MKKEKKTKAEKLGLGEERLATAKITEVFDRVSSKNGVKYGVYLSAIIVFLALILLPPILGIIIQWNTIQTVIGKQQIVNRALSAVQNSFVVAALVSLADVAVGIPMAWLIARGKSKWLNVLDTLSDIPFIVPTAVLGYSLVLFWYSPDGVSGIFGGSLISPGWLLVGLLHFTFSLPVVVRVMVGALLDYRKEFEQASRTLGAPPLTAARTVTFSILKPSLIASFILAFARSISETGATIIVAGLFENGPVFIQRMRDTYASTDPATYQGSVVFASFLLIAVSLTIFTVIRVLGRRLKLPIKRVWPPFERKLSYSGASHFRDSTTLLIFFAVALIPSLFVALPAFEAVFTPTLPNALLGAGIWGEYWQSILLSYILAATVTALNIVIGLPMAILVARKKFGTFPSAVLDLLVDIPLIVPSIALGVSLAIFWKQNFTFIPEILLLIFAHLSITYPYFVRSMSAAVERISVDLEEASRTLGAKPLGVFRTIVLPLTKYSILSGAIMVFTRSVSETGATLAVISPTSTLRTAPVVLVNWVTGRVPATSLERGLGAGFLILFSFIILLALRFTVRGRGRY
jgi:thiamine transport system permease protein